MPMPPSPIRSMISNRSTRIFPSNGSIAPGLGAISLLGSRCLEQHLLVGLPDLVHRQLQHLRGRFIVADADDDEIVFALGERLVSAPLEDLAGPLGVEAAALSLVEDDEEVATRDRHL